MTITPIKEWLYGHTENVSVTGTRLCATFGNVLRIYDISSLSNPNLLQEIPYSGIVVAGGLTTGRLLVSNNSMVAVGQFGEGVVITNLSNYSPIRITNYTSVTSVYSYGNSLYIGNSSEYAVLDVSNPSSPVQTARVTANVDGIFTNGIVICCTYDGTLDIRDMSGTLQNSITLTYVLSGTTYTDIITGLDFYGSTIVVGTRSGKVHKISSASQIIGTYDTGYLTGCKIGVHNSGYAIAAFHDYRVEILDLATTNPTFVSSYDYAATIAGYPRDVRVVGNTFFLAAHMRGVDVVDISNMSSPAEISKIGGFGRAYACTISNDARYLFVTDDWGLRILDISGTPTQVNYIDNIGRSDTSIFLDRTNNYLYCVFSWGGIRVFDVTNPANPITIIGNTPISNPADYIDSVVVYNNKMYCNVGNYMKVFTISGNTLNDLGVSYPLPGRVAYVHDAYNNVIYASHDNVIELIDANTYQQIKSFTTGSQVDKIKVFNNLMYCSVYSDGLVIYDVSNPTNPVWKSSTKLVYGLEYALNTVDGNTLYMGTGEYLTEVDVSNPLSPVLLDQNYENIGRDVLYIDMYNGYMSVAFEGEGIKIFSYAPTSGGGGSGGGLTCSPPCTSTQICLVGTCVEKKYLTYGAIGFGALLLLSILK